MTTKSDIDSPFNWRGKPSIFTQGTFKSKQVFDGANTNRAAMQTRLEPRPTYLISNSIYLKQPKLTRSLGKK